MGSSLPQPNYESIEAIRRSLRGRALYIEQKFGNRRGVDIQPSYLHEVLGELGDLVEVLPSSERKIRKRVDDLEDLCYSAISLYPEPQNRPHYFRQLRVIARLLKQL